MFDFNIGLANFANTEISSAFICLMGIGTVFVGLICLVFICKLLGACIRKEEPPEAPAAPIIGEPAIENKQEIVAAVSAAVAEELGTDVKNLRITSFKKL